MTGAATPSRRRAAPPWQVVAALLSATLLLASLQVRAADDHPVPKPDLESMGVAARQRVEAMQQTIERLQAQGAAPTDLAEAFGHLGHHFHAYRLLDAAEAAYTAARELAPEDFRWAYYRALVRHARGDLETAVADYEAALASDREELPTLIHLGRALLELDRVDEAEQRFSRALELDGDSAAAIDGLAQVAAARGDSAQAAERFERVLELEPDADSVHYPLAQAYRKLGDMERARRELALRGEKEVSFPDPLGAEVTRLATGTAYETVLALARKPEEVGDEEFLGFALAQLGDVQGAIDQLRQGLAVAGEDADTTPLERARIEYVLGGLLVNADRDEQAMTAFRAALELAPELHDARLKLGNALARAGRFAEAATEYGRVLEARPDDREALLKRAAAAMAEERPADAVADLERLLELEPDHREALVRLAASLEATGRGEEAEARYRQATALELAPEERLDVHLRLGSLLRRRGALEEAMAEYRKALATDPVSPQALEAVGGLAGQLGRFDEAAEMFGRLVALYPEDRRARLGEVTALIYAGRHREARERLEAAVAVAPDDLGFKDVFARHLASCPDHSVRDGERAVELAEELIAKVPTMQSAETLAMAYAEAGRFADAVDLQGRILKGLAAVEAEAPPGTRERLEQHLDLYRRGRPCCGEADEGAVATTP